MAVINVYTWDGHSPGCKQRQLPIRISTTANGKEEIRYAFCNAKPGQYTPTQVAQMQARRYFAERAFQECKADLGMGEYQARGWEAWHHHMAMCMMAQAYILTEKKEHQENMPLLSAHDTRQVIMQTYIRKDDGYEQVEAQIKYRHKQRQDDILRRNRKT
jgi:SRSO17 transposase